MCFQTKFQAQEGPESEKLTLERTQKTLAKLVLEEDYRNYSHALEVLGLEKLETKRKAETLRFEKL